MADGIKNINDEIEESYKKVRTWIYKNVEVNKSLTITSRDNLGIIGKYKTNTYSSKEKNKKINVSFDNSSIVTVSIRGNQNIGGISANGSVGISKNGAKSSCIYSWKDKEDVERYLKVQTDMKNIVLEWMTEDSKEGGGIRFSTDESEVYTFTTKDLGDSKYREENGAYINNAFAILAMVTIVALAPEIMSVLGGMTPTIPAWIMLLTIVLGAEYLKDKECEI